MQARAAAEECDLVVRGRIHGQEVGFLYLTESHSFATYDPRDEAVSDAGKVLTLRGA